MRQIDRKVYINMRQIYINKIYTSTKFRDCSNIKLMSIITFLQKEPMMTRNNQSAMLKRYIQSIAPSAISNGVTLVVIYYAKQQDFSH